MNRINALGGLRQWSVGGVLVPVAVLAVGLTSLTPAEGSGRPARPVARWTASLHVPAVVDLTGARSDGSLTVAAAGRLSTLRLGSTPRPFARGAGGYSTPLGPEPYIALATTAPVEGAGCSFRRDDVYAIEPTKTGPGVIAVDAVGGARRISVLPDGVSPNGITFDTVGRFGHRALVTASATGGTMVFAIDCAGRVSTVTAHGPGGEGGIVVAPASFGAFGGDLIVPDEQSGRVTAVDPQGNAQTVAQSGLPSGGDIGVESAGFVPAGLSSGMSAYLADRRSVGNPHPGTDSILRLPGSQLIGAGVQPGDLIVATEGGAATITVRCARACTVRHVANGPSVTHGEGHVIFAQDP